MNGKRLVEQLLAVLFVRLPHESRSGNLNVRDRRGEPAGCGQYRFRRDDLLVQFGEDPRRVTHLADRCRLQAEARSAETVDIFGDAGKRLRAGRRLQQRTDLARSRRDRFGKRFLVLRQQTEDVALGAADHREAFLDGLELVVDGDRLADLGAEFVEEAAGAHQLFGFAQHGLGSVFVLPHGVLQPVRFLIDLGALDQQRVEVCRHRCAQLLLADMQLPEAINACLDVVCRGDCGRQLVLTALAGDLRGRRRKHVLLSRNLRLDG
ncbi:hypothetical protein D9M70_512230 [compost metagenome]